MKKLLKVAIGGYVLLEASAWTALLIYLKKHKISEVEGVGFYKVPNCITNNIFNARIACATQLVHKQVILVDDDFEKINERSSDVAEFILAHELGHIKLGHIKANIKKLLSGVKPTRNLQYELEADTFAATHFPSTTARDGMKFMFMVKGIEQERIDHMYELYEKEMYKEYTR